MPRRKYDVSMKRDSNDSGGIIRIIKIYLVGWCPFWAVLFFVIGLIIYGNYEKALMLGVYVFVVGFVTSFYYFPVLGIILWILLEFVFDIKTPIAKALTLNIDQVGWIWWTASIIAFIGGIITTIVLAYTIIRFLVD